MDIETAIVQWLNTAPELDGIHASLSVPPDRPARFITVERTGGMEGPYRSTPIVAIQAWDSEGRYKAARLAETVKRRLMRLTDIDRVADISIESVTHLPDPGPPFTERYQILTQITVASMEA
ncbi:phage protein [Bifidobacterium sp. DSM 109960]|uniref:Phage protein n=1 Tax=Bifidobacterium erythrocebi TaxID=2675325 RepID=A0A7Y0HV53_9BIFI|nr:MULTISPECIES: hypothetical protein [Bifidobacterium]MBW3095344.1 hypothetical protein [Bifidobacterium pongonis]NMM96288.1 phage protein [Bifidobacterium sp. DSM 109960]